MKPVILLLLLGCVALSAASYMPTKAPDHWRRQLLEARPTHSSLKNLQEMGSQSSHGYHTEILIKPKRYLEQFEKEKKAAAIDAANAQIDLEKRRNLLVGRYGFRIGKRSEEPEDLTEQDYQDLVAQDSSEPEQVTISPENPWGDFIQ